MKLNYFTEGEAKMGKEGLILQATLGLQSCNTKKDCCEILEDIWSIALADQKAKIREWLKQYDQKGLDNLPLLKEFEELM